MKCNYSEDVLKRIRPNEETSIKNAPDSLPQRWCGNEIIIAEV